jgi:glyoxylase-like metal-dependent hydrolase (beta-lactamase superfamily II)
MELFDDLHAFLWRDPMTNNCNTYFINREKRILVDPGHHALFDDVKDGLVRLSVTPRDMDLVIITHGHPDHLEGVKVFVDAPTLVAISGAEMDFIKRVGPHYGHERGISEFEPDILLQEGDFKLGEMSFRVIHTPGHSPGSLCLYWPDRKALFTGDVIFNQGVGRTDLPGGDGKQLKDSIRKLSHLDVDYLLPGHGDIISGREQVNRNFQDVERTWFGYL